jgi:hypothetical protein
MWPAFTTHMRPAFCCTHMMCQPPAQNVATLLLHTCGQPFVTHVANILLHTCGQPLTTTGFTHLAGLLPRTCCQPLATHMRPPFCCTRGWPFATQIWPASFTHMASLLLHTYGQPFAGHVASLWPHTWASLLLHKCSQPLITQIWTAYCQAHVASPLLHRLARFQILAAHQRPASLLLHTCG